MRRTIGTVAPGPACVLGDGVGLADGEVFDRYAFAGFQRYLRDLLAVRILDGEDEHVVRVVRRGILRYLQVGKVILELGVVGGVSPSSTSLNRSKFVVLIDPV